MKPRAALALTGGLSIVAVRLLHRILGASSAGDSSSPTDIMTTPLHQGHGEEAVLASVSFSLAAIVRRRRESQERAQEYVLVHERPPRGWWLPGGGVEHLDATPLDGAVREAVEEAGAPSLLQLLSPQSTEEMRDKLLPSMTHLISLQQSPGRIRFIFRGEWEDDGAGSVLKSPPGDKESIEAKWMTWDDIQLLAEKKDGGVSTSSLSLADPWLRGHEPPTFYRLLEKSRRDGGSVPGLPVGRIAGDHDNQQKGGVVGAFFGRAQPNKGAGLTFHGRAALLTHLRCRLLVCDIDNQKVAVDNTSTKQFPSSTVKNQNEMTLRDLVDESIANFGNAKQHKVGLLRVEHFIHINGREATLTVFPVLFFDSSGENASESMSWVSTKELGDSLERKLAQAALSIDRGGNELYSLDILRGSEGPK